ncbi:hypothetical protein SNE40_023465 [Patella caerulea]|uniref:Uncharacterized protein n=1 Tax=Patella caerulea TaxID=87958 RepID=A0AAN8GGF0_PATCE
MLRLILITLLVVITYAQSEDKGNGPPNQPEGGAEAVLSQDEVVLPPPEGAEAQEEIEGGAAVKIEASRRCLRSTAEEEDELQLNIEGAELDEITEQMVSGAVIANPAESELRIGFNPAEANAFENKRIPLPRCPRLLTNTRLEQDSCPHVKVLLTTFSNSGFCKVFFPNWQKIYFTKCLCRECRGCERRRGPRRFRTRNVCRPNKYTRTDVLALCRDRNGLRMRKVGLRLPDGDCDCKVVRNRC